MTGAIAPLEDVSAWARGDLLVIVLLVLGALLLAGLTEESARGRIMKHIDAHASEADELVRSEAASTATSSRRWSPGRCWPSSTSSPRC